MPVHLVKQLLNETQIAAYLSALGSLAWLVQTRQDVAIYIQALQRACKAPTIAHWLRLGCVIKWCKRRPLHMCYRKLNTPWMKVLAIADAAFRREDSSGLAMRGAIVSIAEDRPESPGGICNVVEFFARRQRKVVRSTFGAELLSLADALEVARMVAYTLAELLVPNCTAASLARMDETGTLPVLLQAITDCKSLVDALAVEETQVPSESSLIMVLLQIKEALRTGTLSSIVWVDTRDMLADALNKGTIARHAIIQFSRSAEWTLQHPYHIHYEPLQVTIPSQQQVSTPV